MAPPRRSRLRPVPSDTPTSDEGDQAGYPDESDPGAGPMPPMFGGGMGGPPGLGAPPSPDMMAGPMGAPGGAPMAGPGDMGGAGFPSTNPALVAQLLGPLMQAQQQDEQRLQQEQAQSVLMVLASMKASDRSSATAATAPAPIPENAQNVPIQGGGPMPVGGG